MPLILTKDDQFELALRADKKPIVLMFSAEWCGPCRMMQPNLQELSNSFVSELDFFEISVDENPNTATKYGVMAIPTVFIFRHNEIVSRQIGASPKKKLSEWLQSSGVLEKGTR